MPTEHIQPRFNILSEGTPQRCDICHQSDQFDPATGTCARCAAVEVYARPPAVRVESWMRAAIDSELDGERVLWIGQPVAPALPSMKFIVTFGVSAICIFFLFLFYLLSIDFGMGLSLCLLMGGLVLCVVAGYALRDQPRSSKTIYCVTENRAVIFNLGPPRRTASYPLDRLRELTRVTKPDGSGNLLFRPPEIRMSVGTFQIGDTAVDQPQYSQVNFDNGFYRIENVAEVERLIRRNLLSGK